MQKLSLSSHPSNHFRLSLRTWLFIFSLLAMLPLLLFAIHTINRISNAQTDSVLRNLQRQSKILTHSTQNELDAAFSALQMLASGAEINRTALPRLYRHAKNVVRDNPAFTAITLTDANEQLLFHSDAPLEKSTLKTNDLELTEPVFKNGRPNLSSLSGTSQNGRPVVILSAPISQGDKLAYCLRLYLGLESFDRLLANELLPSGWVAVIVDAKARVIARSLETNDFFEPNTLSDLLSTSQHNDGRLSETTTLNGTVMTTLVRTLPGVNWRLAVAVPTKQLNAPRLQLLRELMLLTGMWLTLSFLLSQILATYLLRQLKRITSMVEKNSDPSVIRLRINESWQFIQTIALNQRNAQQVKDNLSDTSRQRDEVHALYEQAPCGYYSIDTEGRIIRINQTLILWLGYQLHEMLGYKSSDFLAGDGRHAFKQNFSTLLAQKKLKNQERVFIRKDGSEMPALISAEAVFDDAGQVVLIRAVVFDNTERKLAQQTLADARAREMETGRQIQLTLLSTPQLSAYAGLWLSTFSQASRGVDGDFLDVVAVGDHLLDIVAGDVMGKGVPAALMGAAIKLQFSRSKSELFGQRDTRENPPQPAEIVTAVNRAIAPQLQALGAFATLIYLRIDTQENLLTWVGCGHEEALQISASGSARRLINQHPPLGLLSDESFTQDVCELNKDDALFLCSDGAADALLANGERLGREPVIASAISQVLRHRSPAMALHAIRRDLLPVGATLTDDLTMLLLRHQSRPDSARLELPISLASVLPLRKFVVQQALNSGLSEVNASLLSVAAVELLTNVIAHGQNLLTEAPVELITEPIPRGLALDFKYLGARFESPEILADTDFSTYPESGLGLQIVNAISHPIQYGFEDGVNSVRLCLQTSI